MDRIEEKGPLFRVERQREGGAREIGDMLGRAFAENPVARAALSHCTQASRLLRVMRMNRALVRLAQVAGVLEVARGEGGVLGASLSFSPGQWPVGLRGQGWMTLSGLGVGLRGSLRYLTYERHTAHHHITEPHFYLFVLGVEPRLQGRGIGAALLRSFTARADAASKPCYLETDRISSVRLYERHGFEVMREIDIAPLGGLHMWLMRRAER
ncbi:GNAT family N-acetyltransferase [Polyangium aurulentum]|uniref:GNAT family N-acetyltransferase n=1 Tax=Polyangium aurulentum TaxID=2567896 RepID=UPI0010AE87EC|nr:GNAT family N-acetyltransferase [Polyangium aurulentum]UQA59294.1 GNAT family N-acetyltransferase [Polyangium aurulentum]